MAEHFGWTATVETVLAQEVTLHPSVLGLLEQALPGRAPCFRIRIGTNHPASLSLAAKGETAEEAVTDSEEAVRRALGTASIEWQQIECINVTPNRLVDQDIARIDPGTGLMRPEATIIELRPLE